MPRYSLGHDNGNIMVGQQKENLSSLGFYLTPFGRPVTPFLGHKLYNLVVYNLEETTLGMLCIFGRFSGGAPHQKTCIINNMYF